ncbi:hypothetical protein [Piscirickettsia litoralis]|nr:hypothetical protein [Piscirickettsia litoralis]
MTNYHPPTIDDAVDDIAETILTEASYTSSQRSNNKKRKTKQKRLPFVAH